MHRRFRAFQQQGGLGSQQLDAVFVLSEQRQQITIAAMMIIHQKLLLLPQPLLKNILITSLQAM